MSARSNQIRINTSDGFESSLAVSDQHDSYCHFPAFRLRRPRLSSILLLLESLCSRIRASRGGAPSPWHRQQFVHRRLQGRPTSPPHAKPHELPPGYSLRGPACGGRLVWCPTRLRWSSHRLCGPFHCQCHQQDSSLARGGVYRKRSARTYNAA